MGVHLDRAKISEEQALTQVLLCFFTAKKIRVSSKEMKEALLDHPDFPSLASLTAVLETNGCSVQVGRVPFQALPEIGENFFAQTLGEGLVFVKSVDNNKINYYSGAKGHQVCTYEEFRRKWNGIIVFATIEEATDTSLFTVLIQKIQDHFKAGLAIALLTSIILVWPVLQLPDSAFLTTLIYYLLLVSGLVISVAGFTIEINKSKSRLCSISSQFNCNKLIGAKAGKVYKNISYIDLGLIYFGTMIGYAFLQLFALDAFETLILVSLPVTLFIPYSIFLQKIKYNVWCPICLLVLCVISGMSIQSGFYLQQNSFSFNTFQLITLLGVALLTSITWFALKPEIASLIKNREEARTYRKLMNNRKLFNSLLNQSTKIAVSSSEVQGLELNGDIDESSNTLTLLIDTDCSICGEKIEELAVIMQKESPKTSINLVLLSDQYPVVGRHLIHLAQTNSADKFINILSEWYANKDAAEIVKLTGSCMPDSHAEKLRLNHQKWAQGNSFNQVPVSIFNDKVIPQFYTIGQTIRLAS